MNRKRDRSQSDLKETGIFVFLTLVIFFVVIGFPTLINTSPTVGYDSFEWTPITSAYQQAFAEQQDMETLAYYNFNPLIYSAYLVMPHYTENLPDFTNSYNEGITIETGILEIETGITNELTRESFSPPEILQKASEIITQNFDVPVPKVEVGLLFMYGIPLSYIEIYVFDNEIILPSFIPVAQAETTDVTAFQTRVATTQNAGEVCGFDGVAFSGGLSTSISGDDVVNRASSSESNCTYMVFTFTDMIPSELSDNVTDLQIRFRKTQGAVNHFCIFQEMDGLPTTAGGLVTVDQVNSNATSGSQWAFSSTCASGTASGQDVGIAMASAGDTAFKSRLTSGVHPDGTDIDDGFSVINTFSGYPNRAGVNRFFEMDTSYARITFDEIPTNSSSGLWQLKEHNNFVTGDANDFKFERVGDKFNLNSETTVGDVGQAVVWKTFNATDLNGKDIRANIEAQRTGTGVARVFIDILDGKYDGSAVYSCGTGISCVISASVDFKPNTLREDLGTGDNHRLGIMEVDIGSGFTDRTIELNPNYASGSEGTVTVFVGFKDNSTDGGVNMNITSIEISDVALYEFDKPDLRYFEGVHTTVPTQHLAELDTGFVSSNFTQVGITTLFEDDFTLDPASNGWSESFIPDIDATGDITTDGTDAVLEKTGGTAEVIIIINRTVSTVGFRDLVLKLDARQNNTTYENADNLAIRINSGAGNTTILRDRAELNCVFDDVGEGASAGNTAGCQINIKLEPITFDNTGINILLQAESDDLDEAYFFENFQLVSFSNGTEHIVENLGTLGKDQDAESWFDVAIAGGGGVGTQGDFVINGTGLIDEAGFQDGTGTGGDMDEIRLGNHNNNADWRFLHEVIGSNLTSINFWINGDVDGDPQYAVLGSSCASDCGGSSNLAGIRIFTIGAQTGLDIRQWHLAGGAHSHLVDQPIINTIPADDGNWHMISAIYDKGIGNDFASSTNWARICVDNVCTKDGGRSNEFVTDITTPDQPLAVGGTDFGAGGVENPFSVDEVAIWHGYNITNDLTTLFNSGSGSDASNIGSSFLKGYWKFDFPSTNFTSVPLPTPNSITGGTVTKGASLFLDWVHDGANTTGYRIYRTSTEPADLEVIYNTLGSEDFDEDLDSTTNVTVAHSGVSVFGDEIIAQFDILLMNDTGNPVTSGGLIGGAIYTDATTSTTSNGTLAVSDITVPTQDLTAGLTPFTFKFRDTNLKNITTGFPTDIGVGVFANTSFTGDVSVGLCTSGCAGAGSGRTFDTSVAGGTWIEIGATFDVPINVTAVNQTKLFSPAIPLVNDTGSLDTNFTDTTTDGTTSLGETYFYRIVPLNGDVEGETIVILNGTDSLSEFFVNVTDTVDVIDVSTEATNLNENATDVWQLREHDDSALFAPESGFRAFNGTLDFSTADSQGVHIQTRHGSAYVFKVFNKTDIEGKDILIGWEGKRLGSTSIVNNRLEVFDGAYNRSDNTHFPTNTGKVIAGSAGRLDSTNVILNVPYAFVNTTIPAGDIDYASSTQDQVTFFTRTFDGQTDTSGTGEITYIQIGNDTAQGGNVTLYEFTNVVVDYIDDSGTQNNGLAKGTCTGECPPQPFTAVPILDATADNVWQLKEHDDTFSAPVEIDFKLNENSTLQAGTDGAFPSLGGEGTGYIFKVFNKTQVEGKDFKVGWSSVSDGVNAVRIQQFVWDDEYNRTSNTDFPSNSGRLVKGGGTLFTGTNTIAPFNQNSTVSAGDIDYASSTEDQVTITLGMLDASDFFGANYTINFIQIGNDTAEGGNSTFYNFTNSPILEFTSTASELDSGLVQASECIGECPPQPFTPPVIPPPLPPVLFNTTAIIEDVFLEWGGEVKAYYKFEETSGLLTADILSTIPNADSASDEAIDKTNSGIIGNAWSTNGLTTARIDIGGDSTDWNFLSSDTHAVNIWLLSHSGDALGSASDIIRTTGNIGSEADGFRLVLLQTAQEAQINIYDDTTLQYTVSSIDDFLIVNDDTWHMYTFVTEEGVGTHFYRDGVFNQTVVNTNSFDGESPFRLPVFLNDEYTGSPFSTLSDIDEWSFFSGNLTESNVSDLYDSGTALELNSTNILFGSTPATDYTILRSKISDQIFHDHTPADTASCNNIGNANDDLAFWACVQANRVAPATVETLFPAINLTISKIEMQLTTGGGDGVNNLPVRVGIFSDVDTVNPPTRGNFTAFAESDPIRFGDIPVGITFTNFTFNGGDGVTIDFSETGGSPTLQWGAGVFSNVTECNSAYTTSNLPEDTDPTCTGKILARVGGSTTSGGGALRTTASCEAPFPNGECWGIGAGDMIMRIFHINATGEFEVIIPSIVAKEGQLQTNTTDATVERGTFYQYKVNATGSGNSTSNTQNVTTNNVASLPFLNATVISTSQITLNFTVANDGEGDPSTGVTPKNFTIFKENTTDATGFVLLTTVSDTVTGIDDFAVDAGKNYTYNVEFLNALGSSGNATAFVLTPELPPFAPDQVTGLSAILLNTTASKLTWDVTPNASSYRIYRIENPAPNFTDTFTTDKGWEILDASKQFVNTTSTTFHWELGGGGSESHALEGATLNVTENSFLTVLDDAFSMRFKIDFPTLPSPPIPHQLYFGIKEFNATTTTVQVGGGCSGLECSENGVALAFTSGGTGRSLLTRTTDDNANGWQNFLFGTSNELSILNTTDTFFMELIRDPDDNLGDGADYWRYRLYDDISYSENNILIDTVTASGGSELFPDMQHITFTPLGTSSNVALIEMEIDDLEFFNNVTVIDQWSILVSDTGDTTVMFTDNTLEDGKQYSYIVSGINGTDFGANSTGAKVQTLDEDDINVWQLKEHDDTFSSPIDFDFKVSPNSTLQAGSDGAFPSVGGQGIGYVFKNFNKTDVEGKDFKIGWESVSQGASAVNIRINIADGAYNRLDIVDFPSNAGRLVKGAGVLYAGSIANSGIFIPPFAQQNFTVSGGQIDYASSILDEVSLSVFLLDASNTSFSANYSINFIQIGNDTAIGGSSTFYNFTNPTVLFNRTTFERDAGLVSASECIGQCPPQPVSAPAVQIFNQTETDTATVTDQVQINVTKALQDIATATDNVDLIINKTLADIATVLDQVETEAMIEQNVNDTATILDEFHHNTTKVIRNVEIGSGSGGNVTIFSDDFTVDPAGNGWTETLTPASDATGNIALHSSLTEAILEKTGGSFAILLETDRVIDTTGFTDIKLNFTARQDAIGGVYEPFDFIKIEIDTGTGFRTLLEDRQQWNGTNDLVGEGTPFIIGGTEASTGFLSLPLEADNNANLGIRLSTNPDDTTKDSFWTEFELIGIPSGNVVIFSDDFSVDPASNGWTESTSQFMVTGFPSTAVGTITQQNDVCRFGTTCTNTVAEMERTSGGAGIELIIDRTIDTTGFTDIAFNLRAMQGDGAVAGSGSSECILESGSTGEPVNAFRVFIDYGSGFDDTPYLTDMQQWFGVNGTVGISTCETIEGSSSANQDDVTATGLLALNSSANNNPNLRIRITYTTTTLSADGYLENFELVSTTSGGGTGRFTGDLATVLDQVQLNMTGSISDVVVASDTVVVTRTIDVNQTDTTTVTDQVNLSIDKRPIDIATILDNVDILAPPNAINDLTAISPALPSEVRCNLSWTEPNDNGSPINGYGVFSAVDGGSYITLIANTSNTLTEFNHTGLIAGSTYSYNVTSFNAFGDSEQSNIEICIPQAPQTPSIPTGLTAINQQADVFLDWNHDQQGNPTGYQIERKEGNQAFIVLIADTGTPATNFTDTTVIPATQFMYRISAINAFGTSAPSQSATIVTSATPAMPTLTVVQDGDMITLTWTEPASDEPINGYRIDRRINFGTLNILIANTSNTLLTLDDLNVTKGNTYGYRVRALSSLGEGTVSNVVDVEFGSRTVVTVLEQDSSGFKGGGIVRQANSTFTQDVALDVNSDATFINLDSGNYNYTFIDADSFILNKTFNFPHPADNSTTSFTIFALVFDVACPSKIGNGTDVRIKVNYTDGKDITEFPATPVCDSADKVSWTTRWQGEAGVDMSTMIADFISASFMTNADQFLVSTNVTDTVYNSGLNQIESVDYNVTSNDVTISFDLFLGEAPPSGGQLPSGGGGTPPAGASIPALQVELMQRLTGLSVLSRTHAFASAGDIIEGAITVEWEGEQGLSVRSIDVGEFGNIIRFEVPTFPVVQRIDGSGEFAMSSGDIPYIISLPPFICDPMMGITLNCVDEELISIPITFIFESEGVDYTASTQVMVDLRPIPFDLPQFQIILLGVVLIVSAIAGNFIRTRIRGRGRKREVGRGRKKKFKKKFDSS